MSSPPIEPDNEENASNVITAEATEDEEALLQNASNDSIKNKPGIYAVTKSQQQLLKKEPSLQVKSGESWFNWGSFFRGMVFYVRRLFSFPLVKDPISFARPGDYTASGEHYAMITPHTTQSGSLEVICNYDSATKELFEHILKDRKEARAVKDNYHYLKVDLAKFPGWNDTVIDRLRSTFQVFDISGDGLVDFDELSVILTEFGDTSAVEQRKQFFDEVDTESSGAIDFMDFITMIYNITVKNSDSESQDLADSYRAIDRNMARIRSLDVVQQLQAGLF